MTAVFSSQSTRISSSNIYNLFLQNHLSFFLREGCSDLDNMYDKQFLWVNTETAVRLKNKAGPMRCLGGGDSLSVEKVRRCESL